MKLKEIPGQQGLPGPLDTMLHERDTGSMLIDKNNCELTRKREYRPIFSLTRRSVASFMPICLGKRESSFESRNSVLGCYRKIRFNTLQTANQSYKYFVKFASISTKAIIFGTEVTSCRKSEFHESLGRDSCSQ